MPAMNLLLNGQAVATEAAPTTLLVDLIRDVHALFMRVKFPSTVRCSVVTQLADLEYVLLLTVQQ